MNNAENQNVSSENNRSSPVVSSVNNNSSASPGAVVIDQELQETKYRQAPVIALLIIIGLIVMSAVSSFVNDKINDYITGNQKDSDILARIDKEYPGVFSHVKITKKVPFKNCTLNCGINQMDYEYDGYVYPKSAEFGIQFDIWVSSTGRSDTVHMLLYDGMQISKDRWQKFTPVYNSTSEKNLSYVGRLDLGWQNGSVTSDTSGLTLAGYKYNNLFKVCDSFKLCDNSNNGRTIRPEEDYGEGFYIFYYDDLRDEWAIVTDNGQYLIDWVYQQGKNNLKISQIDWANSPIQAYKR